MTDIKRFDDTVRTERYFTATLLPAILLHDDFQGLWSFLDRVNNEAQWEWKCSRIVSPGGSTGKIVVERQAAEVPFSLDHVEMPDQVEIITEFHMKRDVAYYLEWLKHQGAAETSARGLNAEQGNHDAPDLVPDLVIVVGNEMVVCEGKFFGKLGLKNLDAQLRAQREQVNRFLLPARECSRYRHVALLPVRFDQVPDCSGVLTWGDIAQLSCHVLGHTHYVTKRLNWALKYYGDVTSSPENTPGPWYNGALPLEAMKEMCRSEEDRIFVGHRDGESGILKCTMDYARSKPWHWRWKDNPPPGGMNPKNWVTGTRFLELIDELQHRDGATAAQKRPAGTRYYSGALPLGVLLEKCRTEGDSILVGHADGEAGLRRTAIEDINSKKWKWRDRHDESLGKIVARNWITGKRFLELIEELRDGAVDPAAVGQTG